MAAKQLRAASMVTVKVAGVVRTLLPGEPLPEGVDKETIDRLKADRAIEG